MNTAWLEEASVNARLKAFPPLVSTESGNAVVQLRVRQSLSSPSAPWHLLYCGQLDSGGEHRPTALRTLVTVPCSHSLLLFLDEMGFTWVVGRVCA